MPVVIGQYKASHHSSFASGKAKVNALLDAAQAKQGRRRGARHKAVCDGEGMGQILSVVRDHCLSSSVSTNEEPSAWGFEARWNGVNAG